MPKKVSQIPFFITSKYLIVYLLLIGLIFRLILSFFGVHPDILSQSSWGLFIYQHGSTSFYLNKNWIYEWPNQPPLVNLIYNYSLTAHDQLMAILSNLGLFIATYHLAPGHLIWYFNFVKFFGSAIYSPTNILFGQIIIIKWFAVIADIFLSFGLFKFFQKYLSFKKALLTCGIFLFSPFSWYLSSLWGQYDQISALFFIISLFLLFSRKFVFSSLIFSLAFQVKPTVILFSPFYIYYFFHQKPTWKNLFLAFLAVIVLNIVITLPFVNINNFLSDFSSIYLNNFIFRRNTTLVNHAFNFWAIFFPFGKTIKFTDLIYLLGNFLTVLVNCIAILIIRRKHTLKNLLIASYILTAGSYLFGIGMLDRYFYPAIIILALNIVFFPKLFGFWILSCLLFSLNLFYSWGYPFLNWDQGWQNPSLIRFLSLAQLGLFICCLKVMNQDFKIRLKSLKLVPSKTPSPKNKVKR